MVAMQPSIDPRNGYCSAKKTFHSLRDNNPLPPSTTPLSTTDYVFSLLHSDPDFSPSSPLLIDSATHHFLSYSHFLCQVNSLTHSFHHHHNPPLSANTITFILSPPSFHIPILYFSLLSLGVIIYPANPLSTQSELTRLLQLAKPSVIFSVSSLTSCSSKIPIILLDSPEFYSMLNHQVTRPRVTIHQSDSAMILYSSGTTGRVKGVELTHGNLIALLAKLYHNKIKALEKEEEKKDKTINLFFLPMFHTFGFIMLVKAVVLAETLVLMAKFDFEKMLETVERYRISFIPVSPPLMVALEKSELVKKYDLSSLETVGCGGAPLIKEIAQKFKARFPNVEIAQGYGMTEAGGISLTIGPEECERYNSVGRLNAHFKAKIVDPLNGDDLPPGQEGELWLCAPTIMKGKFLRIINIYMKMDICTGATFHPNGWLKTGDICYVDSDGYLYIVDRLKELIKYKAYQVAPAELERLLSSHPKIADAAVIPYPDEEAGQIPMAFIVREPESNITVSQVMDYVAKEVSPYKRIRRVSFVNIIPKHPSGKIIRRELINQATASLAKLGLKYFYQLQLLEQLNVSRRSLGEGSSVKLRLV